MPAIIVKITITMVLALIGTRLMRRSRAALRHALLAAAFAVLLVLPIATVAVPPVPIAIPMVVQHRAAPLPPVDEREAISQITAAPPAPQPPTGCRCQAC